MKEFFLEFMEIFKNNNQLQVHLSSWQETIIWKLFIIIYDDHYLPVYRYVSGRNLFQWIIADNWKRSRH